ncbi:hypothetical protein C8R47DRAFT_1227116 [Mycena vitilis]|nr:hypothetical protein C8R47DRAFT_1227116 [Mycena vitilis]
MAAIDIPSIKLNTGACIPAIGLGCASDDFSDQAVVHSERWILTAFEAGYRHFDTASLYHTDEFQGRNPRLTQLYRPQAFPVKKFS